MSIQRPKNNFVTNHEVNYLLTDRTGTHAKIENLVTDYEISNAELTSLVMKRLRKHHKDATKIVIQTITTSKKVKKDELIRQQIKSSAEREFAHLPSGDGG